MAKVFVTGGVGFVGRHLVEALAARGDEVRVLDVAPSSGGLPCEYTQGSVTDRELVSRLVQGRDLVFHNASVVHTRQNERDFIFEVNLGGSRNVLSACQAHGVERLVYVSSASVVYDGLDIEAGDELLPYASSSQAPYADSKIQSERELLRANGEKGVYTCAVRPHVIFGPGDTRLMPSLLDKAYAGRLSLGLGRERKLSDFTYIDNLVEGLLLAGDALGKDMVASGQAYFITNGEPKEFFEFVDDVLVHLGLPITRGRVPFRLAYGLASLKEAYDGLRGKPVGEEDGFSRFAIRYLCTHHYYSVDKARQDLGYEPKVSIAEGIERTIQWLRESGEIERRLSAAS